MILFIEILMKSTLDEIHKSLSIYNSANAYGDYFPWLLYFFYWTVQFFFQLFNSAVILFSFLFFFFFFFLSTTAILSLYDLYFPVYSYPCFGSSSPLYELFTGAPNGSFPQNVFSSSKFLPGREIWKQCHVLERTCCWEIVNSGCLRGFRKDVAM